MNTFYQDALRHRGDITFEDDLNSTQDYIDLLNEYVEDGYEEVARLVYKILCLKDLNYASIVEKVLEGTDLRNVMEDSLDYSLNKLVRDARSIPDTLAAEVVALISKERLWRNRWAVYIGYSMLTCRDVLAVLDYIGIKESMTLSDMLVDTLILEDSASTGRVMQRMSEIRVIM